MTLKQILLAAGLALVAGPAVADCADRITFLEEVLDDAARLAISASSGGQGVAGAREAQAVAAEDSEDPYEDSETGESTASQPMESGDALIEARARLGEARAMAEDGRADECDVEIRQVLVELIQR